MALDIQAKVLRALQERVIRRVRGQSDIPVDVRVVTATHRPMLGYVQSGMSRNDLWSRLNTVVIEIPPLRDRPDDIEPLALGFLDRFTAEFGKKGIGLSSDAIRVLKNHTFPGNVRELGNLLRLLVSEAGTKSLIAGRTVHITLEQFAGTRDGSASLPIAPDAGTESEDPVRCLQELRLREFELLMRVLESTRSLSTGRTDRKDAAARLLPGRPKYSTNDFDRWLARLWRALPESMHETLRGRHTGLDRILMRHTVTSVRGQADCSRPRGIIED
jgi:transcriptional regulator with PAS, ATPase and Fis domain